MIIPFPDQEIENYQHERKLEGMKERKNKLMKLPALHNPTALHTLNFYSFPFPL